MIQIFPPLLFKLMVVSDNIDHHLKIKIEAHRTMLIRN